jgi:hypothetical protein
MNYSINQAIHIGNDHIFEAKNLQDQTLRKNILQQGMPETQDIKD